jgi:hypothetical protein
MKFPLFIPKFKANGTAGYSLVAEALSNEETEGELDPEVEYCIKCSAATLYAGKCLKYLLVWMS